ncbi:tRNA glutamyl-Q(34) synthetase GluQRS [Paenibacillus sp. MBLB4367]|uniref:tRNA glutamyl-Q(34) synthetase GluQRS n=1 Tax=Paenibacillus sp. MBLB4367 TaxID=3384767 RepID=UPI00390837DB
MTNSVVRGRFAPTPSGQLHIGNARTALLAWLQIRHAGGQFVLRMEDIDAPRSRPAYAEQIMEDLRWLGLNWDEGPDTSGPYGPYTQSERAERYEHAMARLLEQGDLYACYCSRSELQAIASAPHGLESEGPVYPGTCRLLAESERNAKKALKAPSFRFALPEKPIRFEDIVAGGMQYEAGAGGDFVVKRADGIVGYQLAVVIDDIAMGITDVLRGWDLLDSTPRQLLLYEALGHKPPRFAHVPLLYAPDEQRLSKRHQAVAVAGMRIAGTAPEQIIGWLAYLSGLIGRPEPLQAADLIDGFSLDKIGREPVTLSSAMLRELAGE